SQEQMSRVRALTARIRAEVVSLETQLSELVTMRTKNILSDTDFVEHQKRLQHAICEAEGRLHGSTTAVLTESEASGFVESVRDLKSSWQDTPLLKKRVFGELVLPAGFMFGGNRTPE